MKSDLRGANERYDRTILSSERTTISLMLQNIRPGSKVLEFGPATGKMTQILKEELHCFVAIVEIDEQCYKLASQFADIKILGDIESFEWNKQLDEIKFDYVIFADVLEHLYEPKQVVCKAKNFLALNGQLLISLPNMAHNSIIANLLRDRFQYNDVGLLDYTHIRFFTYYSAVEFINECGFQIDKEYACYNPALEKEFPFSIEDLSLIEQEVIKYHEYGEAYQFVFVASFLGYTKEYLKISDIDKEKRIDDVIVIIDSLDNFANHYKLKPGENNILIKLDTFVKINQLDVYFSPKSKVIVSIKEIIVNGDAIDFTNFIEGTSEWCLDNKYFFGEGTKLKISLNLGYKVQEIKLNINYEPVFYTNAIKELMYNFDKIGIDYKIKEDELDQYKDKVYSYNKQIKECEAEIEYFNKQIKKYESEILEYNEQINCMKKEVDQKDQGLSELLEQYNLIIHSKSWRITEPVRAFVRFFRRIFGITK